MSEKVLLIGNGARENAIAESVVKFGYELYGFISAKNPGIVKLCKEYTIGDILNANDIVNFAKKINAKIAIIGPEAPLSVGVSDKLIENGISCIGPTKILAQIETNKEFARNLMKENKIEAYPKFGIFKSDEIKELDKFIDDLDEVAVKPIGLTGGKGVKVVGKQLENKEEAKKYAREILKKDKKVLIEEKLEGEEFTLQAFCDGKNLVASPLVQDHKAAYENDKGPNTGGMGSYSDSNHLLPFITHNDYDDAIDILKRTINALKNYGEYIGILYGQFMATKYSVKVVEFNARFGDPEAMNILPLIEEDWIEKILNKELNSGLKFQNKATVCKYLVPNGYPENPVKTEIFVDEEKIKKNNTNVYYASVYEENHKIFTTHSRAIALLGIGDTIEESEKMVEDSIKFVKGNLYHRKDIGTKALINKRIEHMKKIRE